MQVFIESNAGLVGDELERELFIVRKLMEKEKVRLHPMQRCFLVQTVP